MALTPRRIRALVFLRDKEERVFPRNHAATTVSHVQHLVVVVACVTGPNVHTALCVLPRLIAAATPSTTANIVIFGHALHKSALTEAIRCCKHTLLLS